MLNCDESENGPAWTDEQLSEAFGATTRSIENWRNKACEEGPLFTKIACPEPPHGHARWALRLLADQLVEQEIVDSISHETRRWGRRGTGNVQLL